LAAYILQQERVVYYNGIGYIMNTNPQPINNLLQGYARYTTEAGADYFVNRYAKKSFYSQILSSSLLKNKRTENVGVLQITIQDDELAWGEFYPKTTLVMYLGRELPIRRGFHGRMRTLPAPKYDKGGNVSVTFIFYGQFSRKAGDLAVTRKWPAILKDTPTTHKMTLFEVFEQLCARNDWQFAPETQTEKILKAVTYTAACPLHQKAASSDYQFVVETCSIWGLGAHVKYTSELGSQLTLHVFSFLNTDRVVSTDGDLSTVALRDYLLVMNNAVVNKGIHSTAGNFATERLEYTNFNVQNGPDGITISINDEFGQKIVTDGVPAVIHNRLISHEFVMTPQSAISKMLKSNFNPIMRHRALEQNIIRKILEHSEILGVLALMGIKLLLPEAAAL